MSSFIMLPASATNSTAEALQGWTPAPTIRWTTSIISSSLSTILLTTWSVLYLNLPGASESEVTVFLRKLKWFVINVLAPEVAVYIAFDKWATALYLTRKFRKKLNWKRKETQWSMTHAFWANMGGVRLKHGGYQGRGTDSGEEETFPVDAEQLYVLASNLIIRHGFLTRRQIQDRSKADSFAKALAAIQISWTLIQSFARLAQGLPLSLLEISTLAYIVCGLSCFGLNWDKPKDVQLALEIDVGDIQPVRQALEEISQRNGYELSQARFLNWLDKPHSRYSIAILFLAIAVFNVIHCLAWHDTFPTEWERTMWRVASVTALGSALLGSVWNFASNPSWPLNIWVWCILNGLYLVARLCLVVGAFASLRSMPASVYTQPNWLNMLPHWS